MGENGSDALSAGCDWGGVGVLAGLQKPISVEGSTRDFFFATMEGDGGGEGEGKSEEGEWGHGGFLNFLIMFF